ncbi:MAG: hypothetical protein KF773_19575 [Deltaproteobacteria bacterium]|nr:hypothetical protein [Deltaproteobacteria bacterium]MCW5801755.1 hypothetical protein [Deltaproteobacteria bacterium]
MCIAIALPAGLAQGDMKKKSGGAPNLAAAQILVQEAQAKLDAAHKSGEPDAGGYAAKAREHLRKAAEQLELAMPSADKRGDGKR